MSNRGFLKQIFQSKRAKKVSKEGFDMKFVSILIFTGVVFLLGTVPGLAIDQSICDTDSKIYFHDNGTLQSCTLAEDYDINDITCQQNSTIALYNTGDLESCYLSEDATIGRTSCQQDGKISFFPDGRLNSCTKSSE